MNYQYLPHFMKQHNTKSQKDKSLVQPRLLFKKKKKSRGLGYNMTPDSKPKVFQKSFSGLPTYLLVYGMCITFRTPTCIKVSK